MPDSRRGRAWIPTLVALVALLAFAPQAGATGYDHGCHDDGQARTFDRDDYGFEADGEELADDCAPAAEDEYEYEHDDGPAPEPQPDPESCDDDAVAARFPGRRRDTAREDRFEDGCLPQLVRGFLNRVWKFIAEVDSYESGELSVTLARIVNVPRKWRTQDDELLDQDATVLVSNRVRVFQNGERVSRDALDAANDVRVHGKLLRPRLWRTDEDGSPVTTIRAKKVYITG